MRIPEEEQRKRSGALTAFGLTLIIGGIGLVNWALLQVLVREMLPLTSISPWSWNVLHMLAMLLVGVIWLGFVFIAHHRLANGYRKNKMWRSFYKLAGYQLCLLLIFRLLPLIVGLDAWDARFLFNSVLPGLIGIALIVMAYRPSQAAGRKQWPNRQ